VVLGGCCLWSSVAGAQTPPASTTAVEVNRYRPSPFSDRTLRLDGTAVVPLGQYRVGLDVDYGLRPLVLVDQSPGIFQSGSTGPDHNVIEHALSGTLLASAGLSHGLEAGLAVPVTLFQTGEGAPGVAKPSAFGVGNPQLGLKARLLSAGGVGLGAAVLASIPVGTGTLTHDEGFAAGGRVFADLRRGAFGVGLGVGFRYHADRIFYDSTLGSELDFAAAATYRLAMRTSALVEVAGNTAAKSPFENKRRSPLEAMAGLRQRIGRLWLMAAAGPGLVEGIGTPIFRAVGSLAWASHPPDADEDGISDDDDRCPEVPEDRDGFEDGDGCPDPDNDGDGLLDPDDKCPSDAEDKDGFEDTDGCPDPDNDKDGVLDPQDKCPDKAETKNGFEDEDGCPDEVPAPSDRDGDGILDDDDECPEEAEDKDGFEDDDGCPDLDNDKDGIPDAQDKCPLQPETINGIEDDDGCPDSGPPSQVRLGTHEIETLQPVFFDTDRARVRHAFYNLLGQVALLLKAHPEIGRCGVEGHTDDTGPPDWNQKLSVMRANSVIEFLAGKGVDRKRLVPIGHGESLPWASNKTEEGRAQNRRVLFHIEGVDIEGQQKERLRAERRKMIQIHKRAEKAERAAGTSSAAPDTKTDKQGDKRGEKTGDKTGETTGQKVDKKKANDKAEPDRSKPDKSNGEERARPGDGAKPDERSKAPAKPGASEKVKSDDKAKSPASAVKAKGNASADEESPESAASPSEDASSASPSGPRNKRLRAPRGAAHHKPDGTEEPEPTTLKDLLKLPER